MKKVALFGGAFNPPHLAHLFTVTYLLNRHDVDEVWLLPVYRHAFNKSMLEFEKRRDLLIKLFKHHQSVYICEIEAEPGFSGKTFDTLEALSQRYTEHSFSLVIGSDNLVLADRWYKFKELIQRWSLIIMMRPGYDLSNVKIKLDDRHVIWPSSLPDVSSSQIRLRLQDKVEEKDWESEPLSWLPGLIRSEVIQYYGHSTHQVHQSNSSINRNEAIDEKLMLQDSLSVFIWGQGRCGSSLSQLFTHRMVAHKTLSLRKIWNQQLKQFIEPTLLSQTIREALRYSIWIIACKDEEIEVMSEALSQSICLLNKDHEYKKFSSTKLVLHCSGSLSYRVLDDFRHSLNWKTAQFHPLYAFKSMPTIEISKVSFSIVTSSPETNHSLVHALAQKMNCFLFSLSDLSSSLSCSKKQSAKANEMIYAIYHAAAVFGANLSLAPLAICESLFNLLGFNHEESTLALGPLFQSALAPYIGNSNESLGETQASTAAIDKFKKSLTGPIARDDLGTIKLHHEYLSLLQTQFLSLSIQEESLSFDLVEAYLMLSLVTAKLYQSSRCIEYLQKETFKLLENK